ncbi:MAG: hypothetical protein M1825_001456 [Sarcosagium campestre]|nr:MAG: hypothetical protein M1825_001456 [Sarcosagium campestre]
MVEAAEGDGAPTLQARKVVYCGVCGVPPEYCEYRSPIVKCKAWLKEHHPDMYDELWSEEAMEEAMKGMSVEQREKHIKTSEKNAKKAEVDDARANEKKRTAKVLVSHSTRGGNKHVVTVTGLQEFIDKDTLKNFPKEMSVLFGSSCKFPRTGVDEFQMQGDVGDEFAALLVDSYNVPKKNVVQVEEKKKSKS